MVQNSLKEFTIKNEMEDTAYHSYYEERVMLQKVQEGNAEEAVCCHLDMDDKVGAFSRSEYEHWKIMTVIAVTLCSRSGDRRRADTGGSLRAEWVLYPKNGKM